MKLLLVADTYYPKVDGTLIFMQEFCRRYEGDLSLLVPDHGKRKGRQVTYVKNSKMFSLSGYPCMALSWSNLRRIKGAIKEADILFIQGPALLSYVAMWYGKRLGKPSVAYLHTIGWELFEKFLPGLVNYFFYSWFKRFALFCYNRCDLLLIPYHDLKEKLLESGVSAPMTVARLGVDIVRFAPRDKLKAKAKIGIPVDKIVVGYVGRVSKEKNIDILLEAFRKLPGQEHLILLIVGDGPTEQVAELKATHNCMVTGFVRNVEEYLQAMDVFVMPSLTETTSLATLEAMATGLPVLVTKVGFMQHYITKDHNGIFFPRNSSTLLSLKLEKVIADPLLQEYLGRNARKTVAYGFSWERSINRIMKLIEKTMYR